LKYICILLFYLYIYNCLQIPARSFYTRSSIPPSWVAPVNTVDSDLELTDDDDDDIRDPDFIAEIAGTNEENETSSNPGAPPAKRRKSKS
jgi:hypothetical protein